MPLLRNLREIKQALRQGPSAWPGMYPTYFITSDGAVLSHQAVRAEWREVVAASMSPETLRSGWHVVGIEFNYEDADLYCEHTGKRIGRAYAED